MAYVGTLAVNVIANTGRFSSGLRTASRDVQVFSGSINRSMGVLGPFSTMLGVGLATGTVAGLTRAGKAAEDFGGAMQRSLAIMSGVSKEMRREMELTAHSVAYNSQFSATEAAKAYYYLASAGMAARQSLAALPQVTAFAQAGNFDLATATDLAVGTQGALGLRSEDTAENLRNLTHVTDVLTKANTLANASIQQFSEALTNKGAAALRMYGLEMEQGVGILAAFANQNIKGEDAGTKLDILLRDLTTKAIQNRDAFKQLNIEVFRLGELREPADIIRDMEKALLGLSPELRKTALLELGFTDKSLSATAALLGQSDAVRKATEAVNEAGNATRDVADNSLTPFAEAWNRLGGTLSTVRDSAFEPILSTLADMIDRLTGAADGVERLSSVSVKFRTFGREIAKGLEDIASIPRGHWAGLALIDKVLRRIGEGAMGIQNPRQSLLEDIRPELEALYGTKTIGKYMGPEVVKAVDGIYDAAEERAAARRNQWTQRNVALGAVGEAAMAASTEAKAMEAAWNELDAERQKWFDMESKRRKQFNFSQAQQEIQDRYDAVAKRQAEWNDKLETVQRIIAETRTPMEQFKADLADIDRLLKVGALTDYTAAARKVKELQTNLAEELQRQTPIGTEQFTPAMERGSLQAYETILKNQYPANLTTAAEATAEAAMKIVQQFPQLLRAVQSIDAKQSKPPVIETGPGG